MLSGMNTDTHSVKEVAADFLRWRAEGDSAYFGRASSKKVATDKAIAEAAVDWQPKKGRPKSVTRQLAFDHYDHHQTPAQVAALLGITYANAHYYKRAFIKAGGVS